MTNYYEQTARGADALRCAYEDCAESHPLVNERAFEQVTCPTCRAELGLPPPELYKNSDATVAATPKPRAGEHTKWPWRVGKPQGGRGLVWADGVAVADCLNGDGSADARRIVACVNACEGIPTEILSGVGDVLPVTFAKVSAERDLLREREKALVEVLGKLLDVTKRANIEVPMSDAPVFFAARELLAKHER